jgi:hypothetical protein
MSKKSIYILLIALVVLVGVFFIQKYFSQPAKSLDSSALLKITFDPQAVSAIQVFKQDYADSGLQFARKDTSWIVTNEYGTPAKSEEIKKLLTDLSTVGGSLRGESEDLYPDFQITEKNALQIKLLGADNSLLAHLYVGKGNADGKSCFIRLPGSPKVYLADINFVSRFAAWGATPEKKLPTDRWMNLNLSSIKRDEISSIKLHTPKVDYDFALVSQPSTDSGAVPTKTWKQNSPSKGTILDDAKIKGIQSSIGSLNGTGVVNPAFATQFGLDKPSYSIWASDTLGNTILINLSDKIDTLDTRYVTVHGRNTVYKVGKWVFERVFVSPFEKPKEPPKESKPKEAKAKKGK